MTLLTAEALSQFWPAEWYSLSARPTESLREWVRQNKFQINNSPSAASSFILNFHKDNNPLCNIAYDCNKFASSAIETIHAISLKPPKAMKNTAAWLAIQSYYASFYAVHSVLRIFGKSCTQLEWSETNILNEMIEILYPNAPRATGGYYNININLEEQTLTFKRAENIRPHHQLWLEFTSFLGEVIESLKNGSQRHQEVMLKLQSLVSNLKYGGQKDGTWLSHMRENINYRHGCSTWFPYAGTKDGRIEQITRLVSKIPSNSLNVDIETIYKDDLIKFFATTTYLVALCCEIIVYMRDDTKIKTFFEHGPLKLLRLLNA